MPDKALISELTWRTLDMQRKALPGMPHYVAPDELGELFRPTTRMEKLRINVVSVAVIADNEKDFREFMSRAKKRGALIIVPSAGLVYPLKKTPDEMVALWRNARREGAAKAGGIAKANKDERLFWAGFSKIADRWHLPAKEENASPFLVAEAETSRNTVRSYLGYTREEWQRLTPAKRERILKGKLHVEA
jgi:hypothetical protein